MRLILTLWNFQLMKATNNFFSSFPTTSTLQPTNWFEHSNILYNPIIATLKKLFTPFSKNTKKSLKSLGGKKMFRVLIMIYYLRNGKPVHAASNFKWKCWKFLSLSLPYFISFSLSLFLSIIIYLFSYLVISLSLYLSSYLSLSLSISISHSPHSHHFVDWKKKSFKRAHNFHPITRNVKRGQ